MADEHGRSRPVPSYLANAARVWAAMLRELHPEYDWTVEVVDVDGMDAEGGTTSAVSPDDPGSVLDDAHSTLDRHTATSAGAGDDDRLDQAA